MPNDMGPLPAPSGEAKRELSLDAVLRDEIVRLTMAADGVSTEDIRALSHIVPLIGEAGREP